MITEIIGQIITFFSFFILFLSYNRILKKKHINFLKIIIMSVLISILNILGSYDVNLFIKLFITIITLYTAGPIIYDLSWKESMSITLIYFVLIFIGDLIVMLVISPFESFGIKYLTHTSLIKAIATLLSGVFIYLVLLNKRFSNFLKKIIEYNNSKFNLFKNSIYIILVMIISLLFFIIRYLDKFSFIITLLFFISCISILFFVIYSMYKSTSLKIINEFLLKNEKAYETIIENDRIFRHNIVHELNCIKSLSNERVSKIIDEYIKEHIGNNIKFDKLIKLPSGLKGLVYEKMVIHNLEDGIIVVDNEISSDVFNNISIKKLVKLYEVFGIIIDNAIEACVNSSIPSIYIYLSENDDYYKIKCTNTFNNYIDVEQIGNSHNSTKDKHYGVGLKYAYNQKNIRISSTIHNDKFISLLTIKK